MASLLRSPLRTFALKSSAPCPPSRSVFTLERKLKSPAEAKTNGYKEMWVAHGAVHANSFAKYPDVYKERVEEFLERVKKENL
jgi:hypothetical protein